MRKRGYQPRPGDADAEELFRRRAGDLRPPRRLSGVSFDALLLLRLGLRLRLRLRLRLGLRLRLRLLDEE